MSIIYDALKKVQKNFNAQVTAKTIPLANPVKTKAKTRPVFIYAFLACLVIFLANFGYNFFAHTAPKAIEKPASKNNATTQAPAIKTDTPTLAPIEPAEPKLVLNGVFFEEGSGYALINNKILRVGDEILRAKVKEITINYVELEFEGKTIKLLSPS